MRVTRETPTELVVSDSSLWMSIICGAAALLLAYFGLMKAKPSMFLVAGLFAVFAAITVRGTTFAFDGIQRLVHWKSYWLFRAKSGTVRLEEISDVTVEAMSTDKNATMFRLVLQTANGPLPMANMYTSSRDGYAHLRQQILAFLRPGLQSLPVDFEENGISSELASSILALLRQGRRIDAVTLLRSRERISLTEAKKRIDAFDARCKTQDHTVQT